MVEPVVEPVAEPASVPGILREPVRCPDDQTVLSTKEANEAAGSVGQISGALKTARHPLRYARTRDNDSWVPVCPGVTVDLD